MGGENGDWLCVVMLVNGESVCVVMIAWCTVMTVFRHDGLLMVLPKSVVMHCRRSCCGVT